MGGGAVPHRQFLPPPQHSYGEQHLPPHIYQSWAPPPPPCSPTLYAPPPPILQTPPPPPSSFSPPRCHYFRGGGFVCRIPTPLRAAPLPPLPFGGPRSNAPMAALLPPRVPPSGSPMEHRPPPDVPPPLTQLPQPPGRVKPRTASRRCIFSRRFSTAQRRGKCGPVSAAGGSAGGGLRPPRGR